MKQFVVRVAAVGLAVLTLVGCSSGANAPTPTPAGGSKPVNLNLLSWMGVSLETSQAVAAAYTKQHPNVHITLKDAQMNQMQVQGGQVNTAMLDGIDVAILPLDLAAMYNQAGSLKDLSNLRLPAVNDAVTPLFDELGKENGQRYGVPIALNPSMMQINEKKLTALGAKVPRADWTMQDLEQLLTTAKAGGVKISLPLLVALDPVVRAYGGRLYDSDKHVWTLDTPEVKQGLAELAKLVQGGWVANDGISIELGPNAPALSVIPADAPLPPAAGGGVTLPFPKGPKGRPTPVSAMVAVVNKSSANADIAADFVRALLADPAAQMALAKSGIRPLTADSAAMSAWRQNVGDRNAEAIDLMMQGAYVSQPFKFYASLASGLQPYLTGSSTLDQVLPGLMNSLSH